jgi:serine protease Do
LVEQVSPAVVSVNVVKKMTQEELLQQQIPEILKRFFGNQVIIPQQQAPQEKTAYGSAFLLVKMVITDKSPRRRRCIESHDYV